MNGTAACPARGAAPALAAGTDAGDWLAYGHTWAGTKWSPLAQLTPANVTGLKQAGAWTPATPAAPDPEEITYELTPIKVGDTLYACTPHNTCWRSTRKPARCAGGSIRT
jgi:quinoprotein glucose dehydrogenase